MSFALQTDGKIVLPGSVTSYPPSYVSLLVRLGVDGRPDPTFGVGGTLSVAALGFSGVKVQPDGRLLAPGGESGLFRFDSDGGFDASFGLHGVTALYPSLYSIVAIDLQSTGAIVAFGSTPGYSSMAIARALSDGERDSSFGNGGGTSIKFGDNNTTANLKRIAVQPDDAIVVVAQLWSGPSPAGFGLARLDASGQLDAKDRNEND